MDIDHNAKTFRKVGFAKGGEELDKTAAAMADDIIQEKFKMPVKRTVIETDDMKLQRATNGLFGIGKERTDEVSGYICRVFHVYDIKVNQKSRAEHLAFPNVEDLNNSRNANNITDIEYFSATKPKDLAKNDVGLARKIVVKNSHFKANVWMSEEFPCSVQRQLIPVLQLMSLVNSHFEKLSHFISINLPKGFPVQLGECNQTTISRSTFKYNLHILLINYRNSGLFPSQRASHLWQCLHDQNTRGWR